MPESKDEVLKILGLERGIPTGLEAGPISPDVMRAQMTGPVPEGVDTLKEGMLAFIYVLAQTIATTPPFDELNEAALDVMKRIGKTIDINEALIKAQTIMAGMPGVGAAPTAMPTGVTPTPAPTPTATPTPETPTSPEATFLEGIEIE